VKSKVDFHAITLANEFAGEELKMPSRVVPIFGKVFELEISAGKDILELSQTDNFVALGKGDRPRFQREAECLAFVKTPANPRTVTFAIRDEKIPATLVTLITRIDTSE
jgi:hypothetical protein